MIDAGDIQEQLDKEPFEPFRISMADGESHEVTQPNLAAAMDRNFFLALPRKNWMFLAYEAIIRLESIHDD